MSQDRLEYVAVADLATTRQVREQFDDAKLAGLMQSLEQVGMLHPIRVRTDGDRRIVVDGERRLRAASRLGWAEVPVIVEQSTLSDASVIQRQLIANCQRFDLSPVEKSRAIQMLLEASGGTASQVAAMLGLSPATVSKLLAILALPEPIQAQIDAGKIPASSALDLARVDDRERQLELAAQLASGTLTRDGVSGAVKQQKKPAARKVAPDMNRVTAALPGKRTVSVAGPGLTLESFINWLEELLSKARKARPTGVELTTFVTMLRDQARTT